VNGSSSSAGPDVDASSSADAGRPWSAEREEGKGSTRAEQRARAAAWLASYGMVLVLVAVIVVAQALNSGFAEPGNIRNIFSQNAALGLVAIGATFVIIGGGFDLSAGAMYALGGVVYAQLATTGTPVLAAVVLTVLSGTLVGLVNGVLVNGLRINPFVATLGSSSMILGLAYVISDSLPISALGVDGFDTLGRERLFDLTYSVYLFLFVFLLAAFLLHATVWGRNIFALGGNREAARLAGVRTRFLSISTYVASGSLAALGGVVIASRTSVGQPNIGGTIALDAITVVIVGGTTLFGGEGAIWRTFIGLMILGILRNTFDSLALSNATQLVATGAILVAAVAMDAIVRERRGG